MASAFARHCRQPARQLTRGLEGAAVGAMSQEEIRLYASHRQFYVQDSQSVGDTGNPSFWSDKACHDRLALAEGILGIGTGSYDFVTVRAEMLSARPPVDLGEWDHVTEGGLQVRSGLILLYGCLSDSGLFFRVQPGPYRVRCCYANLAASVDSTGNAGDWYLVQFWPSRPSAPRVLKRWRDPGTEIN